MRRTGFEPLLVCGNKLLKLARRRQRFRKLDAQSSYGGEAVAPVWPAACGSDGNRFPAPPKCLHGLGSFRGNGEEPRGIAEDVESALHQQFDQKSAASRRIFQPPLIKCNSRRLHHLLQLIQSVGEPLPAPPMLRACVFTGASQREFAALPGPPSLDQHNRALHRATSRMASSDTLLHKSCWIEQQDAFGAGEVGWPPRLRANALTRR